LTGGVSEEWVGGYGVGKGDADLGGGPLFCCRAWVERRAVGWLRGRVALFAFSRVGWLVSSERLWIGNGLGEVWMSQRATLCVVGG